MVRASVIPVRGLSMFPVAGVGPRGQAGAQRSVAEAREMVG